MKMLNDIAKKVSKHHEKKDLAAPAAKAPTHNGHSCPHCGNPLDLAKPAESPNHDVIGLE